jgi:hypothetical protein
VGKVSGKKETKKKGGGLGGREKIKLQKKRYTMYDFGAEWGRGTGQEAQKP